MSKMYDTPIVLTRSFPAVSATAAFARTLIGPNGLTGRIRDCQASITTGIAWGTSAPILGVTGTQAITNTANLAFMAFPLAVAAAPAAVDADAQDTSSTPVWGRDSNYSKYQLAPNTAYTFTVVAAVGSPAGVFDAYLQEEWFD